MLSKDDLTLIMQLIQAHQVTGPMAQAETIVKRLMVLRNNVNEAIKEVDSLSPSVVPND